MPNPNYDPTNGRARQIVELASKRVKNPSTKSWLWCDERGTWERYAREYLETSVAQVISLGMSEDQVNNEIADRLAYLALDATLTQAKRKVRS